MGLGTLLTVIIVLLLLVFVVLPILSLLWWVREGIVLLIGFGAGYLLGRLSRRRSR